MSSTAEEIQAELLRRIAARDREALSELYDQTAGALFSFAARILGDAHEAEEVIQDVFVQIWDKAKTFDPTIGVPFHWVASMTRNRSIDRLRARQRRSRLLAEWEASRVVDAPSSSATAPAGFDAEEIQAIRTAVDQLPAEQRRAIELAFFAGQSHGEIAETLGEPLGTIKARIRRGMMKLRESLQVYS